MQTKVAIIYPTDPFYPKVGGVATLIKGFIKYAPQDFDIEFIGTSSDIEKRPLKKWTQLTVEGRAIRYVPVLYEKDENKKTKIPLSLRFTWALKRFHANYSDKLIFFHTIEPAILFTGMKCPKVLIIHNDIEKQVLKGQGEVLWGKMPWVYFQFEKMIMPSVDHVYSESGNTIMFYHSKYFRSKEKFSFLPTWVDAGIFCPVAGSKLSLRQKLCSADSSIPLEAQWILFTGRLQKQKNPIRIIDAFAEYRKKNLNSVLILIGGGNMKLEIEHHVQGLGLRQKVFLLPEKQQPELVDYYRAADVFVLASNYEGMSVSVLEALACGLPVVSTEAGEARRVIRKGFSGEVVQDFSPTAICEGLATVLGNPGVYTSQNCLEAVSEYTAEKVLMPLYETMRTLYKKKCTG